MKSYVSGIAKATTSLVVDEREIQVYQKEDGSVFALDGSFLQKNDSGALYIPDPYQEGSCLQLLDPGERASGKLVAGKKHNAKTIAAAVAEIKLNLDNGDSESLEEMLNMLPLKALINFLCLD